MLNAPWLRGSNENTNGLLRQVMIRGTALLKTSQKYINNAADLMNVRRRMTLGWKVPNQELEDEFPKFKSSVALAS